MTNSREFICDDCGTSVFEFGITSGPNVCHGCQTIREMKAKCQLTPKQEADLRKILHCQLPRDGDVYATIGGSDGQTGRQASGSNDSRIG